MAILNKKFNLLRVSKVDSVESFPLKSSTLYKWHHLRKHPEMFIKLEGALFVDLDAFSAIIEAGGEQVMAKLTNKLNLPQQIVSAIMRDPYSSGGADISVTQLIQPARIIQLRRRHFDEIEEDASDRIWSLLGQTCHKILERADDTGAFHEERIFEMVAGWTVSGATDCYITKNLVLPGDGGIASYADIPPTVRDYKFIKVMAAGFPHPDWEQQCNLNAFLFLWIKKGFPVERLEVVAIFRDWSKVLAERDSSYLKAVEVYRQKLWPLDRMEAFITARVVLHQRAEKLGDELLPFCTSEEQWRKPAKWAVMSPTAKKAKKLCNSEEDAIRVIRQLGTKHYIEFRPATAMRCEMFCDVRPFCNQYALEHWENRQKAVNE